MADHGFCAPVRPGRKERRASACGVVPGSAVLEVATRGSASGGMPLCSAGGEGRVVNSSSREMIEHTLIIGEFQQLAVPATVAAR